MNPLDEWKETRLQRATWTEQLPVVKLLVKKGAQISLKNDLRQTASDVARSEGMEDVAEWLDWVSCR